MTTQKEAEIIVCDINNIRPKLLNMKLLFLFRPYT